MEIRVCHITTIFLFIFDFWYLSSRTRLFSYSSIAATFYNSFLAFCKRIKHDHEKTHRVFSADKHISRACFILIKPYSYKRICITQVLIDHIIGNYSRRSGNSHQHESRFSVKYDHLTVADIHSEILDASPGPIFFINARKRSLQRLRFHRCLSVHGGCLPQVRGGLPHTPPWADTPRQTSPPRQMPQWADSSLGRHPHPWTDTPLPSACWHTVNKRVVRIPLECILVSMQFSEILAK